MTTLDTSPTNTKEAYNTDSELLNDIARKALMRGFSGKITYSQGDLIEGVGTCQNLGYGDIEIRTQARLVMGECIELSLNCLSFRGMPVYLQGRVAEEFRDDSEGGYIALVRASNYIENLNTAA
ncbi:MAG: hypothetical protein COA73_07220 [Candidatus Hydrogenedentota bacterium]|nr:MAG: hypothetical protein COA73_07220 [Candidatus Hydrogenedentota bacterium]